MTSTKKRLMHVMNLHKPIVKSNHPHLPRTITAMKPVPEIIEHDYKIGDTVNVFKTMYDKFGCVDSKKKAQGIIHSIYNDFVVVQFERYRECFSKFELKGLR